MHRMFRSMVSNLRFGTEAIHIQISHAFLHQGNGFFGNDGSGFHPNQSLQVLTKTLISGTELFGTSLIKLEASCMP